ncbi:dual specificity protein phosphatase 12 isoform X4 [Pogoniulus pusillus]|uniref:dual specificity protein phosphatase 12 isoform X4 n=1 Tax=Pogoniulus pusillus TaxID=488313 RepID=UPI0030B99206
MAAVLPGLYVGGAESCSSPESLAAAGVVAVLTVDAEEAPAVPGVRAMHVRALDEPGADLLSHLDDCAAFIGAARAGGGAALVRCHAGVSRSVAVVAAYLMKTEGLGWEQACAAVRAARPEAEVNLGFQEQLKLYETMGCAVDSSSALYKRYRLQMLTERNAAWLCDLIQNFILNPLQSCTTCPERSLPMIQPIYVTLRTQRFSTDAGNAGVHCSVAPAFCPTQKEGARQPLPTRGQQTLLSFVGMAVRSAPLTSPSLCSGWSQRCLECWRDSFCVLSAPRSWAPSAGGVSSVPVAAG